MNDKDAKTYDTRRSSMPKLIAQVEITSNSTSHHHFSVVFVLSASQSAITLNNSNTIHNYMLPEKNIKNELLLHTKNRTIQVLCEI